MKLYFGNGVTTATTVMILALCGFIGYAIFNHAHIQYWGRRSAILLVFGLVVCCFAAARDGLDKTIQNTIDGSCVPGLFQLVSVPTIVGCVGALAITGNILFYGKSGFVPAKTKGVRYADDPEADYFLIKELIPGFLDGISGTCKDPEGYFVCEKDPEAFERFEAMFPKKEKKKLPGQLF